MSGLRLQLLGCAAAAALSCAGPAPKAGGPSVPVEITAATSAAAGTPRTPVPAGTPRSPVAGPPASPSAAPAQLLPPPEPAATVLPFQAELAPRPSLAQAPASRYAALSPAACRAEIAKRSLAVEGARRAAPGVATPMQISGSLHGVEFVAPRGKSVFGILDCRLALALDDVARILDRHGVTRVRVDNFYRPSTRGPGKGKRKRSQHALGLAMDLMDITLRDERTLRIDRDWRGARGAPACGPEARPSAPTEETVALRNIVCDVAREGLFHRVLTPNYDAAHESHLHLDIGRDARALTVR